MASEVKVPAVGESVQEAEIYKWHKKTGDFVEIDQVLLELETDKATVEIVAESSGVLEILVDEGETVTVGDLLARVEPSSESNSAPVAAESQKVEMAAEGLSASKEEKLLSPAARRVAVEHHVNVSSIDGSSKRGIVTKEDILTHLDKPNKHDVSDDKNSPPKDTSEQSGNLKSMRGQRREKMSRLRQKIAERLVSAQHEAAMLTTFNEVDMSSVMNLRKRYKEEFKEVYGVGLGFMSFFVTACTKALESYPEINGYIDGKDMIFNDYVDIGVAVSTNKGLMVPVLRDCSSLSFDQIETGIMDFAQRGRAGKITVDDLTGGTFTISNGGVFGSLMSTPILNPPQSAILGMHKIQERPVAINGEMKIRPMMYLALSYDHRVVDGKGAVGFLVKIKDYIEDPARLLLGV